MAGAVVQSPAVETHQEPGSTSEKTPLRRWLYKAPGGYTYGVTHGLTTKVRRPNLARPLARDRVKDDAKLQASRHNKAHNSNIKEQAQGNESRGHTHNAGERVQRNPRSAP